MANFIFSKCNSNITTDKIQDKKLIHALRHGHVTFCAVCGTVVGRWVRLDKERVYLVPVKPHNTRYIRYIIHKHSADVSVINCGANQYLKVPKVVYDMINNFSLGNGGNT
jgi:hypothetical protein